MLIYLTSYFEDILMLSTSLGYGDNYGKCNTQICSNIEFMGIDGWQNKI